MVDEKMEKQALAGRPAQDPVRSTGRPGGHYSGFTLVEMLIVIVVMGILLMMAVPTLQMLAPRYMLGSTAKSLDSLMQKARLTAHNTQKPIRMVVDCRPAKQPNPQISCTMLLYSANFDNTGKLNLTVPPGPWTEVPNSRRHVPGKVLIGLPTPTPTAVDASLTDVYWAVFMPTGKVQTSHNPMRLLITPKNNSFDGKVGVSLSQQSGRVTVRRR